MQLSIRDSLLNARDLALDEPPQLLQLFLLWRIVMEEGLRQAHCSDGKADHVFDVSLDRDGQLATAAAKVDQQGATAGDPRIGEHSEMDEPAFLQSRDNFGLPAGGAANPIEESAAVARVTQGAGGDYADAIGGVSLDSPMKSPQHL